MAFRLTDLRQLADAGFDDVIDARSPSEFAEDRLPGAINLPVLDDAERARVGTIYTRESRFLARKIGAARVIANISAHLEGPLSDRPGGWRPLVYCWRGGQRSGTFAWLLSEIGWSVETLQGGYRSYRRLVVRALYDTPLPHRLVVLDGMTCTGKTELLAHLRRAGMQVLDLEALAAHRGSVFGGLAAPQPSQKAFESAVAQGLEALDPARPVVVEAESSKIGTRIVPPSLWSAMCAAPRVRVEAPMAARAAFFRRAYPDLVADPQAFRDGIALLHRQHGARAVAEWQEMVGAGAFEDVAAALMEAHYDPRYAKSTARFAPRGAGVLRLASLEDDALQDAVPDLAALIEGADAGDRPATRPAV